MRHVSIQSPAARPSPVAHPLFVSAGLRVPHAPFLLPLQAADVVTCGGLQSAHTVAVAAACAEHGRRAHLLVRGERPAVPTGHHLYARMLAHRLEYVPRSEYADRGAMFAGYLERLQREHEAGVSRGAGSGASTNAGAGGGSESSSSRGGDSVAVIPEGAACSAALLGLVRLVAWLAQHSDFAGASSSRVDGNKAGGSGQRSSSRVHIVVDSGTGATATGECVANMQRRVHAAWGS